MDNRTFYKKFFSLVLPMAIQNFMTSLVSATDALMLGMLDQNSLAAVSLAGQIQFVLSLFLNAFCIGESVLAAQYWGKGDKEKVEKILGVVLQASMTMALIFGLAALLFPGYLMRIYTNDEALISLGIPYLRVVSVSYLFMSISQMYLCIMKNTNRPLKSTIYGSTAVVVNIFLNAILIFGLFSMPALGIVGAAIATTIARACELTLVLFEHLKKDIVKIRLKNIVFADKLLRKDYFHYTIPSILNQVVWGCGFSMFSVIMGHLGSDGVAANSIAQIVRTMAACFCGGMGAGTGIMIGNELGRGDLNKARWMGDKLVRLSLAVGTCSGMVVLLLRPFIMRAAGVLSATSSSYLYYMLFVCSYYMIGKAFSCTLIGGVFSAGGDTRFGLICDTINMWLIIVPIGWIAAFVLKLPVPVVYFLLNLDEFTKMPVEYIYYKRYRWLKNITR